MIQLWIFTRNLMSYPNWVIWIICESLLVKVVLLWVILWSVSSKMPLSGWYIYRLLERKVAEASYPIRHRVQCVYQTNSHQVVFFMLKLLTNENSPKNQNLRCQMLKMHRDFSAFTSPSGMTKPLTATRVLSPNIPTEALTRCLKIRDMFGKEDVEEHEWVHGTIWGTKKDRCHVMSWMWAALGNGSVSADSRISGHHWAYISSATGTLIRRGLIGWWVDVFLAASAAHVRD